MQNIAGVTAIVAPIVTAVIRWIRWLIMLGTIVALILVTSIAPVNAGVVRIT